jgi:outer membrane protein TolC
LAGLLLAAGANARANEPSVDLPAALEAAWQRSLSPTHTDGLRQRAAAEQRLASRPWSDAPQLELSQRSDRWQRDRGARETELGLNLPLWHLGQRDAQRAAADGLSALAEAESLSARWTLAGQVREQAWLLRQRQAAWRSAEAHAQGLNQLAADVARRVQAGDLAETDGMAARAEALAAAAGARQAWLAWQQARQQWQLLTGLNTEVRADEPQVVDPAAPLDDSHPLLRRADARLAQARQHWRLSRHAERPAPELRLGWRQEQALRGAEREGSVVLGLRIPLGTNPRAGVQTTEALTALNIAELERQRLREQLESERQAAHDAWRTAQQQAEAGAEQARLLRTRASLLQKAFDAGEAALPELLRALSAAAQAEAGHHQSQADLGLAQARLKQAQGLLP